MLGCGNPPQSTSTDPFERFFSHRTTVFGIPVFATASVQEINFRHAAAVLAEYLDNDENGQVDDPAILQALIRNKGALCILKDEDELDFVLENANSFPFEAQALFDHEIHPGGAARGEFDATLEEVLHLYSNVGLAKAYPEEFGESPGTSLSRAMDLARGGYFDRIPTTYPASAWYSYSDRSCDYECQATEYFYWAMTTLLGAQDFPGRAEEIRHEWRFTKPEQLRQGDPAIYQLLTKGPATLPKRLPDGLYGRDLVPK
ncbi:MAG: hypothetical protein DWQ01_04635 [Planctomycetota bacterium]|nr:MAG: hypothetical protein DWQ01_04635 [Planctomycetota bacterium]